MTPHTSEYEGFSLILNWYVYRCRGDAPVAAGHGTFVRQSYDYPEVECVGGYMGSENFTIQQIERMIGKDEIEACADDLAERLEYSGEY